MHILGERCYAPLSDYSLPCTHILSFTDGISSAPHVRGSFRARMLMQNSAARSPHGSLEHQTMSRLTAKAAKNAAVSSFWLAGTKRGCAAIVLLSWWGVFQKFVKSCDLRQVRVRGEGV